MILGAILRGIQLIGGFYVLTLITEMVDNNDLRTFLFLTAISQVLTFFDVGVGTSFANSVIDANSENRNVLRLLVRSVYLNYRRLFIVVSAALSTLALILITLTRKLEISNSFWTLVSIFIFFFLSMYIQLSLKVYIGLGKLIQLQFFSAFGILFQIFGIYLLNFMNMPEHLLIFIFILPGIIAHLYMYISLYWFANHYVSSFSENVNLKVDSLDLSVAKKWNFEVTLFQFIQFVSGLMIPFMAVNMLEAETFNTFQMLNKIFMAFTGAAGVLLPQIWRDERFKTQQDFAIQKFSSKMLNFFLLCVIGLVVYIFWGNIFSKLKQPSLLEISLWIAISFLVLENTKLHFRAMAQSEYRLLTVSNLSSVLVVGAVWLICRFFFIGLKAEFLVLIAYGIYRIVYGFFPKNEDYS